MYSKKFVGYVLGCIAVGAFGLALVPGFLVRPDSRSPQQALSYWAMNCRMFAKQHEGRLPVSLSELYAWNPDAARFAPLEVTENAFELRVLSRGPGVAPELVPMIWQRPSSGSDEVLVAHLAGPIARLPVAELEAKLLEFAPAR